MLPRVSLLSGRTTGGQPRPPQVAAQAEAHVSEQDGAGGTDSLLDPAGVSRMLSVSVGLLERWRGEGTGPAFLKLSRRVVRYRRRDVERYVHECLASRKSAG